MDISYRQAVMSDFPDILRMSLILNEDETDEDRRRLKEEWIPRAIKRKEAWVASCDEKVIGYVFTEFFGPGHRYFPNSIFISELYVEDGYRRQGIGKKLVKLAMSKDYPKEYTRFSITHDPDKPFLTKYYEDFGFKKIGATDQGSIMLAKER